LKRMDSTVLHFPSRRCGHALQSKCKRILFPFRCGATRNRPKGTSPVLVTHQVDIISLTGVFPQSGEIVVLRPDGENLTVVGRTPHR